MTERLQTKRLFEMNYEAKMAISRVIIEDDDEGMADRRHPEAARNSARGVDSEFTVLSTQG